MEQLSPLAGAHDVGPFRGRSIMIVDDDPDVLAMLRVFLTGLGATVHVAANATTAIDVMKHACPDVVLCDLSMPAVDGYDLLRMAQENGITAPVVAISARHFGVEHVRALQAGFAAYLPKPSKMAVIVAAILDVLDDEAPPAPLPC